MSTSRDVSAQIEIKTVDDGSFQRAASVFRDTIEKGGKFEPEIGRYHLYVSYGCPWATRTLIMRKLKGIERIISITIVSPYLGDEGWAFGPVEGFPDVKPDLLNGARHLKEIYLKLNPDYSGRFTVPVLWDKKLQTIVNNESSEIIRILNSAFNDILPTDKAAFDYYPKELREEIDSANDWIYNTINNGVYKAGFASTQAAYDQAIPPLFESLDRVEKMLTGKKYLIGDRLTECDLRLWVTMIRFDPVYAVHFKCNIRDIRHGYPAINAWMKNIYWNEDAFKSSTNFKHIKTGYYWSHVAVNASRIVPAGPIPDIEPL